ncbi:pyrroline-5-carboxylate reductase [Desulfotomaculum copahuensis]|uniref:Pyrroline-5-carboxylate reductase n=1 Tax=Desulfotomaculum copahuensis TaxID=1838280 RepID=A0A1B7LEQ6_9FIRM|nr:pyrroline-5-carboxylate reductase [Desulfotomaculum copahuensis]OAT81780.1 pyrroline-5-carboxylate reductase [Desulfotomaculum copahuensis]
MVLSGLKIGCLGGGAMAEALLTGLLNSGIAAANLFVSDVRPERIEYLQRKLGINGVQGNRDLVQELDIVILAVKPQMVEEVLHETGAAFYPGQTLISIAAGIPTAFIEGFLSQPVAVIRVMPNTACLLGAGASALCAGKYAGAEDRERAMAVFSAVGKAVQVSENLMDAVTGLSGSGPAYMFVILEAMADAGVRVGLPRDIALLLSAQTMLGAARMVMETQEHPGRLKNMVTTPGGTAIAGVYALEEGGLRVTLMRAVEDATGRSREMSAGLKTRGEK